MNESSTRLYNQVSEEMKPAFFQLVHHPVQATQIVNAMWISSGVSALRASQARLSTNQFADATESLFDQAFALEQQYHQLLNGKFMFSGSFFCSLMLNGDRQMGSYDGPDPRHVLLLATADGQHVCGPLIDGWICLIFAGQNAHGDKGAAEEAGTCWSHEDCTRRKFRRLVSTPFHGDIERSVSKDSILKRVQKLFGE